MNKVAIVGFGCAGYNAAKAMRQAGYSGEIHVFEKTAEGPANPMLTTYYAGEKLAYKGAFPFGTQEQIESELKVIIHKSAVVEAVHAAEKEVVLAGGEKHSFDKILLSTGARAVVPTLSGAQGENVFLMRTMEDAARLKTYLDAHPVKNAVVVGGSMVGIKVAELLYNRGIQTAIADMAPYLFPLAAYEDVGREIERRIAKKGIRCKWNAGITEITEKDAAFSDGERLLADIVCLCIGTRANVQLVANTEVIEGQPVKINRAIVVDDHMRTSCPGIYAAGDCCEGTNLQSGETMIIGLWANAGMQGETAGKNMAGEEASYSGNIVHNITHFMGMDFIGLGDNRLDGERYSFGNIQSDNYIEAVLKGGRLQSVNILGNYRISGILKNHLLKELAGEDTLLGPVQKGLLVQNGLNREFVELIGGSTK